MVNFTAIYDACVLYPAPHVLDCKVVDYEALIPSLKLPDDKDRHVLAAAIRARADVIVTFNLKHFPPDYLGNFDVEAQHPDDFARDLFDLSPGLVCKAARDQRLSLKNPPKEPSEFLDTLERMGLPQTVGCLRPYRGTI